MGKKAEALNHVGKRCREAALRRRIHAERADFRPTAPRSKPCWHRTDPLGGISGSWTSATPIAPQLRRARFRGAASCPHPTRVHLRPDLPRGEDRAAGGGGAGLHGAGRRGPRKCSGPGWLTLQEDWRRKYSPESAFSPALQASSAGNPAALRRFEPGYTLCVCKSISDCNHWVRRFSNLLLQSERQYEPPRLSEGSLFGNWASSYGLRRAVCWPSPQPCRRCANAPSGLGTARMFKPHTRWWWPGNALTKADITWQLEQMAAAGDGRRGDHECVEDVREGQRRISHPANFWTW